MRGERVHEPRLDEERASPFDGFLGLQRGALEDGVDRAHVRLSGAGGGADLVIDDSPALACHRMHSGSDCPGMLHQLSANDHLRNDEDGTMTQSEENEDLTPSARIS